MSTPEVPQEPIAIGIGALIATSVGFAYKVLKNVKLCDDKQIKDAITFVERVQEDNVSLRQELVALRAQFLSAQETIGRLRARLDDQDEIIHALKNEVQKYRLMVDRHNLRISRDGDVTDGEL